MDRNFFLPWLLSPCPLLVLRAGVAAPLAGTLSPERCSELALGYNIVSECLVNRCINWVDLPLSLKISLGQLHSKDAAGAVMHPHVGGGSLTVCALLLPWAKCQRISSGLCFLAVILRVIIGDDLGLWGVERAKGR